MSSVPLKGQDRSGGCLLWEEVRSSVCVCVVEYYSAIKKNDILPFATTWMDLEGIMLSEIIYIEKDKYCMISLICEI